MARDIKTNYAGVADKNDIVKTIGRNIKRLRESNGITREQMAKDLFWDSSSLGKYERGAVKEPKIGRLLQICDYFGVTLDDLTEMRMESDDPRENSYMRFARELFRWIDDEGNTPR